MREIKRGDMYYANLNPITGSEQGGIRPVLILQNDKGNRHSPTTIVAALTSRQTKSDLPTHVTLTTISLERKSIIMLEQIRTIDKSRLLDYIGSLSEEDMQRVNDALTVSLGLE